MITLTIITTILVGLLMFWVGFITFIMLKDKSYKKTIETWLMFIIPFIVITISFTTHILQLVL